MGHRRWMDAMPKIMIVLAAVVLLILVIGFLAMRFLRPDDSDPFEDLPAEPTSARRAADDDLPRARNKQGARAVAARRPSDKPERQLVRAGRGPDDRGEPRASVQFADRQDRPSDIRTRASERPDRPDRDRPARPPAAKPRGRVCPPRQHRSPGRLGIDVGRRLLGRTGRRQAARG
jgi:hypothetical protein